MLSIKEILLEVHVTLVKQSAIQKLDGMNVIIQLKVQNHRNDVKKILTTVLHGLWFQMLQKMLRPVRTQRHHILLYGNLILTNMGTLKDWFYLEMKSHRPINDIIQTSYKEIRFSSFQFVALSLIRLDN